MLGKISRLSHDMNGLKIHGSAMHRHKMHGSTVAHSLVKCKVLMLGGLIRVLIRLPHPHRAISVVSSVALLFIVLHPMLLPHAAIGDRAHVQWIKYLMYCSQ